MALVKKEVVEEMKLAIGVDFGTYASGFAYSKLSSGTKPGPKAAAGGAAGPARVSTHERWPDQPTADPKTRTAVLYHGTKLEAWGWTAWRRWSAMSDTERSSGRFSYLENFKLLLAPEGQEGCAVDTVCPLPAGLTAVQVVADFLTALRRYIADHLRRFEGITLSCDSVTWCLTVPAMWTDKAKSKMRQAAKLAGMVQLLDSASLLVTLEPEAAALAAVLMKEAVPGSALREVATGGVKRSYGAFASGSAGTNGCVLNSHDVLLVLDCGGGTADVTLHRVRGSGANVRLDEAAVGRGALAGGRFVDAAAWTYLRGLLGPAEWDSWKRDHPGEWLELMSSWERAKRSFAGAPPNHGGAGSSSATSSGQHDIRLRLPPALQAAVARTGTASFAHGASLGADGTLVVPGAAAGAEVFGPVVDRVLELAWDVVGEGERLGASCNKVLLAGGFARSPYLQRRVKEAFYGQTVIVPGEPGAAVVMGALLFGQLPDRIASRRCRRSYGISTSGHWTPDDAVNASNTGYPEKWWNEDKDSYYCSGKYSCFVKRGEIVTVGQVVQHTFYPSTRSQTGVAFELYETPNTNARYILDPDMRLLGKVTLSLPSGWAGKVKGTDYPLKVEMRFGGTELVMVARDPETGNAVATTVEWAGE